MTDRDVLPDVITFDGESFHRTGKVGTHRATGEPSAEYENQDQNGKPSGKRVWRRASGVVEED